MKWKALLALVLIYVSTLLGWNWVWGILFLSWTIPSLYSGRTYLVEVVNRDENPVIFWLIIGTWLLFSVLLIFMDLFSWSGVYYGS